MWFPYWIAKSTCRGLASLFCFGSHFATVVVGLAILDQLPSGVLTWQGTDSLVFVVHGIS